MRAALMRFAINGHVFVEVQQAENNEYADEPDVEPLRLAAVLLKQQESP